MRPVSILWENKIIHTIVGNIEKPKSQVADKKVLLFLSLALDVTRNRKLCPKAQKARRVRR